MKADFINVIELNIPTRYLKVMTHLKVPLRRLTLNNLQFSGKFPNAFKNVNNYT
jgi:hypothetical protein